MMSFRKPRNGKGAEKKEKAQFYWDIVYTAQHSSAPEKQVKMTKSKARLMLNVGEDEKMTGNNIYRAWRRLAYPLELRNLKGKAEEGYGQVELHEAYQVLIKNVKPGPKVIWSELDSDKIVNTTTNDKAESVIDNKANDAGHLNKD